MGEALCGKEQRHKDLGRNESMWGRGRLVREKTENRKEPRHGATLSFLLCGMTRLVFFCLFVCFYIHKDIYFIYLFF